MGYDADTALDSGASAVRFQTKPLELPGAGFRERLVADLGIVNADSRLDSLRGFAQFNGVRPAEYRLASIVPVVNQSARRQLQAAGLESLTVPRTGDAKRHHQSGYRAPLGLGP